MAPLMAVYSRPGSAGDYHDYYRQNTPRQISNHYISSSSPNSPVRIYGTRFGSQSADNLAQVRKPPSRSNTAPDLRTVVTNAAPPTPVKQTRKPIEPILDDCGIQPVVKKENEPAQAYKFPAQQPQVSTPITPETPSPKKSLKNRLRRALSFSSTSSLDTPMYKQANKSTDNMSIASTASSASMMLRKVGHGLSKKTKRSFNGIFSGARKERPDTPVGFDLIAPETTYTNAEVDKPLSPVTRAKDTLQLQDNVDGHGSVGFPKLSLEDSHRRTSVHLDRPLPIDQRTFTVHRRESKSFDGKGILKKVEPKPVGEFDFSFSTDPSLDYSTPVSNRVCTLKFSPRITIHDTYTHSEYDRRGEVATCNRLTPLIAQRIKEELNAYKMDEMDVAEASKVYTHFFT